MIYRVIARRRTSSSRDELARLAGRERPDVRYVVGDHLAADGRGLLSAAHLRELVPDFSAREVFLCGPPAMADAIAGSVRRAGVPRKRLHAERFAL